MILLVQYLNSNVSMLQDLKDPCDTFLEVAVHCLDSVVFYQKSFSSVVSDISSIFIVGIERCNEAEKITNPKI